MRVNHKETGAGIRRQATTELRAEELVSVSQSRPGSTKKALPKRG